MSSSNSDQPNPAGLNWKDSIATNIQFFREQGKLLDDAYNPGQVASGALMTVLIMNHNMAMNQITFLHQRLAQIEALLQGMTSGPEPPEPRRG